MALVLVCIMTIGVCFGGSLTKGSVFSEWAVVVPLLQDTKVCVVCRDPGSVVQVPHAPS